MRGRFSGVIAAVMTIVIAASGCAYTFHPERRGNTGGEIAGGPLIGDLLWFIPGIVPGVVFLIVDFSSGAIYREPRVRYRRVGMQPPHSANAASGNAQARSTN